MFDRDQHIGGATALDGTADGACFGNIAYAHALVSGARPGPAGLPPTCNALLQQLENKTLTGAGAKANRDNLVQALVADSNVRCGQYVQFLQMYQGNVNSIFGIGSQLASLVGALAGGGTANAFSGISGTIQGAGNTLNKNTFQDKALELIAAAFAKRRERIMTEMNTKLATGVDNYGTAQGVSDAMNYHNACSISAGFQELAAAITTPAAATPPPPPTTTTTTTTVGAVR
jgi:hypothetical protein